MCSEYGRKLSDGIFSIVSIVLIVFTVQAAADDQIPSEIAAKKDSINIGSPAFDIELMATAGVGFITNNSFYMALIT